MVCFYGKDLFFSDLFSISNYQYKDQLVRDSLEKKKER